MIEIDKTTTFDYVIGGRFGMKWLAKMALFVTLALILSSVLQVNIVSKVLITITALIFGVWATADASKMKGCSNGKMIFRAFIKEKKYFEKPPYFKEREYLESDSKEEWF
ncbi:hypothetical protein [Lactococcus petauri]|uniref:Uncharacterized protein n=1 Tax=Lactococcus petauri TaxID=1940789 RepID=A0A252CF27_9LACT|nr:hypothetical protein [Lactococcus petauri]OUK05164.1 hypothetical protein BZZ03_00135 [Lactococcus petauri]